MVTLSSEITMKKLQASEEKFELFSQALCVTDFTFLHSYLPSRMMEEGQISYIGKYKLYDVKVDMSVLPTGLAVSCTDH